MTKITIDRAIVDQAIEAAMADQVTHGLGITLGGKRIDPLSIYKQAEPATSQESRHVEPVAWLRAIDEAMVVHDCGVVDHADDYDTAKRKLNTLLNTVQDIGSYFASSQQHAAQVVYQISMKDGAASSAWVDVDEATYNSAKLYGEFNCRCLYTLPPKGAQTVPSDCADSHHPTR